jgi:gliding motility-associated-like protein
VAALKEILGSPFDLQLPLVLNGIGGMKFGANAVFTGDTIVTIPIELTIPMLRSLSLLAILLFLFTIITCAQEGMPVSVRPCGSDRLLAQLRKDPTYLQKERAIDQVLQQMHYARVAAAPPGIITVPVVVHIINEDPNAYTDAAVIQAIQALNEAYSASGAFAGGRTDTQIRFCLAKTAPDGGRTTGIIRTHSYLSDFDVDMEGDDLIALGAWDRSRYMNIWVVTDIKSEYMQDFECGTWTRLKMAGYAGAGGDVVVAGLGVDLVAHEVGHYLSLEHTFAARDCRNDDCLTDGDKVCDTPPERTIDGGGCANPQNSCNTDSLSGFTTDVTDLPDNFMDYGSGAGCIMGFTPGQAERMRNYIASALPLMQNSTVCNDPCGAAVTATFTRDKMYPVVGDVVTFAAATSAGQTIEWLVDGSAAGTGPTLTLTVTQKKTYQLALRVTDNASGCRASTTDAMPVSCGVVARFWPSKRKIASKENIETDHVVFTNRSRNATAWKWLMSNDKGMAEQVVSTDEQLDYPFKTPGTYKVRLYATNGSCKDTTNTVTIVVDDPTADGVLHVERIDCYQQDKVRVELWFENRGYKAIPKNTPVSFYDDDPRTGRGSRLGNPFLLPADLPGKCVSYKYTAVVETGRAGLDTLVTVMNDNGSTIPLALPNTGVQEVTFNNNVNVQKGFGFRASLNPDVYTLAPQEQAELKPVAVSGGVISSAAWESSPYLNCTNCINTTFTALYRQDTVATVKVRAYTKYACYSEATATIHIPVVDDYTVKLNKVDCSGTDSLHVDFSLCNSYTQGNIPASLQVDLYDRIPDDPAAVKLGSSFVTTAASTGPCSNYEQYIRNTTTGNVWALVNKDRLAYPPATGLNESVYDNNTHNLNYTRPVLTVFPRDTTVFRKAPFNLYYNVTGFTPVSILWGSSNAYTLSCNTCASPVATMLDSSMVNLQMTNQYGCELAAKEYIHIFPPDITIELLSADCYDNEHVLAQFRVCVGNGYDTINQQIPVAFYNGDPDNAQAVLLSPRYYTPAPVFGACREFTHVFSAPGTTQVSAVVNDKKEFKETNYTNNRSSLNYEPFTITGTPGLISLARPANVTLHTTVNGGVAASYLWEPSLGLSCPTCAEPVAAATSSMKYLVTATNKYYCKDTATVAIKTFVNAPVAMPNAFSPNGDGKNDYFYVIGSQDIRKVKNLSVFNRYGQKIFESLNSPPNDRQYGWDGAVNGKKVDMGTYVYYATLEYMDGSVKLIKGTLIVVP